jgi:hypothetical protein
MDLTQNIYFIIVGGVGHARISTCTVVSICPEEAVGSKFRGDGARGVITRCERVVSALIHYWFRSGNIGAAPEQVQLDEEERKGKDLTSSSRLFISIAP